jgi:type I restriction enzyme S subunit
MLARTFPVVLTRVPMAINQDLKALRGVSGVQNEFLAWQLRGTERESLSRIDEAGHGTKALRMEAWTSLPMCVPPKHEQAAIAAFLDCETAKIDALVEQQQRLIALLKEKRQAVISHAVTKGLDPKTAVKESGVEWLGKVPAHWEIRPMKYLASIASGGTPSKENPAYWNGDIPWASAKDLKTNELSDTGDHISVAAINDGVSRLEPSGSVLVLVRGMMLARTFPVVLSNVPIAINQDLKALQGTLGIRNEFLAWLLRGAARESLSRIDEAGHGTKALRMEAWTSLPLCVPPATEQQMIVDFLNQRTREIHGLCAAADTAIALLQERRSSLVSAVVTGKIDVRGLAPVEAEAA